MDLQNSAEFLSIFFIILINMYALIMVLTEYRRAKQQFVAYVGLGQLAILGWHILTFFLIASPGSNLALGSVSVLVLCSSVCFLFAAALRSQFDVIPWLRPQRVAAIVLALLLSAAFAGSIYDNPVYGVLWILTSLAFLASSWITLHDRNFDARRPVGVLQFLIAPCYGYGIVVLLTAIPELGGLFYLVVGMIFPTICLLYVQDSMEISFKGLQQSNAIHRELFNSVRDVFFRTTPDGVIEVISNSVSQFGYLAENLVQISLEALYVNPKECEQLLNEVSAPEIKESVPVEVKASNGDSIECELSATPVFDDAGQQIAIVGTIRDVSERNLLERQFQESQRRESLGILAGGMAHDFNNLLQAIVGRVDLILMDSENSNPEIKEHLDVVLEAANTAALLCKHLLDYTGKSQIYPKALKVEQVVGDVVEMINPTVPNNIHLQYIVKQGDLTVESDVTQLKQVLFNLIKNGIEAIEDCANGGSIIVSLGYRDLTEPTLIGMAKQNRELLPGEYACIEVTDTGPGIDPEISNRIFDPFFSTKQNGHGLGLSSIAGILRSHGAGIEVQSALGRGSTFRVLLPLSDRSDNEVQDVVPSVVVGHNKTILLVDDEQNLREAASRVLQAHGYQVLQAADGHQAVELFRSNLESISAVLMDIKMPNKDGIEAAREIRSIRPGFPIILTSGYLSVADRLTSSEAVSLRFLSKPYQSAKLLRSIDSIVTNSATV